MTTPNEQLAQKPAQEPGDSQSEHVKQYKSQSLSTMAQGELLVKLFEEMMKQCRLAAIAIHEKDYATTNDCLLKAQTIVSTLAGSLDMRYPISKNLRELYIFLAQQLLKANMDKSIKTLKEIAPIMKELRDSFLQAEKISRREQHAVGGKAV